MKNELSMAVCSSLLMLTACAADESAESDAPVVAERADELFARSNPCDLVRCRQGFVCQASGGRAECVPDALSPKTPDAGVECRQDSDCRLQADYCGGCNCLALAPGESAPKCSGDEVACFVWPCHDQSAHCVAGSCELSGSSL
jgi:hypothetical protein